MSFEENRPRWVTELDHVRLLKLVQQSPSSPLSDWLPSADTVASHDIDADVVTMYSQVQVSDVATGQTHKLTVCYPHDAEPDAGFVSVLSPVGAALLGQRIGHRATVRPPAGEDRILHIDAILFQPEATGDYVT